MYSIALEDLQMELDRYTDYLESFTCPAEDCSLCMAEICGRESLQEEIDRLEDMISVYQEGRQEQ